MEWYVWFKQANRKLVCFPKGHNVDIDCELVGMSLDDFFPCRVGNEVTINILGDLPEGVECDKNNVKAKKWTY